MERDRSLVCFRPRTTSTHPDDRRSFLAESYRTLAQAFSREANKSIKKFEQELWRKIYQEVAPEVLTMLNGERTLAKAAHHRRVTAYLARRKEPKIAAIAKRRRRT